MSVGGTFVWKKAPKWNEMGVKKIFTTVFLGAATVIVNEAKDKASGPSLPKPKHKRGTISKSAKRKKRTIKVWTKADVEAKLKQQKSQVIDKEGHRLHGKGWRVRVRYGRYRQNMGKKGQWTTPDVYQVAIGSGVVYAKYVEKNTANITLALLDKLEEIRELIRRTLNREFETNINLKGV